MANQQFAIVVVLVHPVPFAITEERAIFANSLFRPRTVSVRLETIVPNIHEVVSIDISLMEVGPYAWAAGNRPVYQDGSGVDSRIAFIEIVTYLMLITT